MGGKILLFGFEDLPAILAVSGAAEPFGIQVVPVARGDYGRLPLWRDWTAPPAQRPPIWADRWEGG